MLEHTFCHIPSVGPRSERNLWNAGFHSWECVLRGADFPFSKHKADFLKYHLAYSESKLSEGDPRFFTNALRSNEHWRIFSDFRKSVVFLDIETTGNGSPRDHITTVTLYDGLKIRNYVYGENLSCFAHDIQSYKVVVTYGGKSFDFPFIRSTLGIPMDQAHVDLRYTLASLGYTGGLKGCEKKLGLDRKELVDMNGYFAVLLWREFKRKRDRRALETLQAYNMLDVIHLEPLMVKAYNLKVQETPFGDSMQLPMPKVPRLPVQPDRNLIERLSRRVHAARR